MGTKGMDKVKLRPVNISDAPFLYALLKERDKSVNISHKKVPSYGDHLVFIKSEPYSVWYIVEVDGSPSGSVYLTKSDEIGVFISKSCQGEGIGGIALDLLTSLNPRSSYLANIAPGNVRSQAFFLNRGFKLIQKTYSLETL